MEKAGEQTSCDDAAIPAAALSELVELYAELDRELGGIAVRCEQSGLCCDFERSGLTLMATGLEVAHARKIAAAPAVVRDEGAGPCACPFFVSGGCTLREGRPLGCRSYFCAPWYADKMQEVSERYHRRIVGIHEKHGLTYGYQRFVVAIRGDRDIPLDTGDR